MPASVNGKPNSGSLIISNHLSSFDIFLLLSIYPYHLVFLSKPEYFKIPFVSASMRLVGHLAINRNSARKAQKSLKRASKLLDDGIHVAVFPEGTRSTDGKIKTFHSAPLSLLKYSDDAGLLPITIVGSDKAQRKGSLIITPTTIKVIVHKRISNAKSLMSKREGKQQLMKDIENEIKKSYQDALSSS